MRTDPDPALLEAAFLDHPSAVCVLRLRDLTFVAVNPAFEEATGWPASELLGRRPDEVPLIAGHEVAELLRQAAHLGGGPDEPRDVVARVRYVAKDGSEGVARLVLGLSARGGEAHLIAAFTDASVAVSQEEAIGRREAILEAAGFGAQMFLRAERWEDAIGDVLRRIGGAANVSRAHVFENVVLPDGAAGTTHRFEWCAPGIEPQIDNPDTIDQPWSAEQDDWRAKLAAGEAVVEVVRELPDADRSEFSSQGIVSILDVPIFAGREWWGSIGFDECERERHWARAEIDALRVVAVTLGAAIHRQQTERSLRETEELYRTLVEQIPAVAYVNLTGEGYVPLYTSPGIEEMLGVTSQSFMEDRLWFGMVHPDDRDRVFAEDARTEETLDPFAIEYRMIRPDGKVVWVSDQAEIVRDERGQPRFWSGVMFDISNLKRAEEDLARALSLEREASARLRSLDDLKNTFLQAVSHDLRTPLAAVLGSALTLERDDIRLEPDVERDLARRIAVNARKLQRLVTDLLDLDRLSRGLTEPNRADVDLADVIRTVMDESETANDREVTLELEPTPAAVDVPKVERIVENLLVNAVRHTQEEAHIWIRVSPVNGGAILVVEDDGPGLSSADRERVFGAFERGTNASAHAPGSGIGLTLVARFAELHGGRAWAEEREGGGASFLVWLPPASPDPVVGPSGP